MSNDDFDTFECRNREAKGKDSSSRNYKKEYKQGYKKYDRSDFISMFSDLFNTINYKVAIFLFILGILIFSDSFVDLFLLTINGAVDCDMPTTKGTTIQLTALTLGYVIIDLMVSGEII